MNYYGGIEAGGTKFICMIGHDPEHILSEFMIPTKSPDLTIPEVIRFFKEGEITFGIKLSSIGIATFGPLNLSVNDPGFGTITSTPKTQWQNTPLYQIVKGHFNIPVQIDTDVNGAAIGEGKWGAGIGFRDFVYITIGTGIGGGIISCGKPIHGLTHPEIGHMLLHHDPKRDPFLGICPFHKDCLEGMASGPSMTERWGISTYEMEPSHPAWDLEAHYLAQAIHNLCLICSPQRIILGGGVMKNSELLQKIRKNVQISLKGYIDAPLINDHIDEFIVPPLLGDRAGVLGAIALASQA
ncbi:MAG: ROK family protein [Chloroflexi bacterium]|nr:ROK family protein [Chloroflexota bacterium]